MIGLECEVITVLVVGYGLAWLFRVLKRSRPDFRVGPQLAIGFLLRLLVIEGVSATGIGSTLRGGDELGFLAQAKQLASLPLTSSQWLPTSHVSFLHVIVFALQDKLFGNPPQAALRVTQVGIALAGVLLLVAAVHDLAGPRAARLAAWLLCLEPASLLFNEALHKEPNMELASGLVAFGGTKVWKNLEVKGMALMLLGGLIALGTRQYVGWFVFACSVLLVFHAALRRVGSDVRTLPMIYGVVAIFVIAAPVIVAATSTQSLQANLQSSQNANTEIKPGVTSSGPNGNNLALESVDFSSRSAIITNLPQRIRDVLLRPYPWQLGDINQEVGVLGSLVALTCFFLLIRYAWLSRGQIFKRAGPLLYPFLFLLIAYSLAVGNAGTGYRYRTHLVTLALAAMVVLREAVLASRATASEREAAEPPDPVAQPAVSGREAPAF